MNSIKMLLLFYFLFCLPSTGNDDYDDIVNAMRQTKQEY